MSGERRAVQEIWKLLEQAMDDVGCVLPAWVHMRIADRFCELAEEAGLRFMPPEEVEPDWHRLIDDSDDTGGA